MGFCYSNTDPDLYARDRIFTFKSAYYSILTFISICNFSKAFNKEIVFKILSALEKGSKDTVSIAIACAASGIIVGILSITGLGSRISSMVIALSGGQPLIALFLTMLVSIILGMGLPTTAAYLVLASVVVLLWFRWEFLY